MDIPSPAAQTVFLGKEIGVFHQTASPLQDAALCVYLLTTSQHFSTLLPMFHFFCQALQHLFWDLIKVPYHHGKRGARSNKTALMNLLFSLGTYRVLIPKIGNISTLGKKIYKRLNLLNLKKSVLFTFFLRLEPKSLYYWHNPASP